MSVNLLDSFGHVTIDPVFTQAQNLLAALQELGLWILRLVATGLFVMQKNSRWPKTDPVPVKTPNVEAKA